MITLRTERMSDHEVYPYPISVIHLGPHMTKYHFQKPGIPAEHVMTDADPSGRPHDHPFAMTSFVTFGGYREQIFAPDGSSYFQDHRRNDRYPCVGLPASNSFLIPARRVHRIVEIFDGECHTMTLPHAWEQDWGLWEFRTDGAYKQIEGRGDWIQSQWNEREFRELVA